MATAHDRRRSYETVPRPFVPPVEALNGANLSRRGSLPIPHPHISHGPPPATLKAFIAAGPAPTHLPRSMASQPPPVPFPHPEHAPVHTRLPPRPMGHGRSGSSVPYHPILQPPLSAPPAHDAPAVQRPSLSPLDKSSLPKAPTPGGLGLFVAPPTPVLPHPPDSHPRRPPPGSRRATVSECQRPPAQEVETDQFIEREHNRLDKMWEWEQEQRRREVAEQRRQYEEQLFRTATQQPLPPRPSRKKSPESHHTARSASPEVLNEHGIPTPPPSMSPSAKALNVISTKEDRERWRHEIRDAFQERDRRREAARDHVERVMREAEQERLRGENSRRDRARKEAEAMRAAMERQAYGGPSIREAPNTIHARRQQETRRQVRSGRRGQRESGYLSSGRSTDGLARSTAPQHWRSARARRFYGEGRTDLRDEGHHQAAHIEDVEEIEWLDVDENLRNEQEARVAKAGWDLYETKWAQFFKTPPAENSLRFVDIPWPSLEPLPTPTSTRTITSGINALPPSAMQISAVLNPTSIASFLLSVHHSSDKSRRTRLRAALLRFHPDKVGRWMSLIQASERDAVVMGVEIVVRCLNELMKGPDGPVA